MKKDKYYIVLFVFIIINYILTRFIFFKEHGMKDFPNTMSLLSAALACFFILSNNEYVAISTVVGNLIAFIIGLLFNTTTNDFITGNTNNLWLIWIISYIIIVLITFFITKMFHVKQK